MKKIIISLALLLFPVLAAAEKNNVITAMLHHTPIKYQNSTYKEDGKARGVYLYWGRGLNHSFEGAFDHTWLKYKGSAELKQNDATFLYTNYQFYPYKFTLGAHRISGNLYDDNVWIFLAGINNYVIGERELQLNFRYSRYGENASSPKDVFQINPEYGNLLLKGGFSSLYFKMKGYYIHLNRKIGLDQKDTFYSLEAILTYYYKKLQISGFGWGGEQAFAVRGGGFVVYNLPEIHTGGYGGKIGLPISSKTFIFLSYANEIFNDVYTDVKSRSVVGSFAIAHTF